MWDGTERRSVDVAHGTILKTLEEIRADHRKICERLDKIEKSVNMVSGAWMFAKYLVALPVALWGMYLWVKEHVH